MKLRKLKGMIKIIRVSDLFGEGDWVRIMRSINKRIVIINRFYEITPDYPPSSTGKVILSRPLRKTINNICPSFFDIIAAKPEILFSLST